MSGRTLTSDQVRAFFDRFGARQDGQAFYEDAALDVLVAEGGFESAGSVLEFGCGTGRFALRLLKGPLPEDARYGCTDFSTEMIRLTRARLHRFADRVTCWQGDGAFDFTPAGPPVARIVTTYVMDLLPPDRISAFVAAARDALEPGGRLCVVSLGWGTTPLSRLTARAWSTVARLRPQLVGGCRPIRFERWLNAADWSVLHSGAVTAWTIPSDIVIASRRDVAV